MEYKKEEEKKYKAAEVPTKKVELAQAKKIEPEQPKKEEKKSPEQNMTDVLVYLRDNVVHGQSQHVERINKALEKGV